MRKYMKNKEFISEKFYNKKKLNREKKENSIIVWILIINLILIPITSKNIVEFKDKSLLNKINHVESKPNEINSNNIITWIENTFEEDITEAYITNNNGNIVMNNLDGIDKISKYRLLVINEVNIDSNGKYKLGVSLYE